MSSPVQALLAELGARVRGLREGAGRTVLELAREAGISRRYLTETEAGRANPSLSVLARLAAALGVPLGELLDLGAVRRATERIALVGLRGAGKSTVGRLLARALEAPFVELDRRVEEESGLSLAELFDLQGEAGFCRFEAQALERVLAEGGRLVLATGGSIALHDASFRRLRATCRTAWLVATPEEHLRRVQEQGDVRPMRDRPHALDELRAILDERRAAYERCEIAVDTTGHAPAEVAARVLAELGLAEAATPVLRG